jgi:hypothetical protein
VDETTTIKSKKEIEKKQQIIILTSNIIILVLSLYSFYSLFIIANELNNEISYKNYLKQQQQITNTNPFIIDDLIPIEETTPEQLKFNNFILIALSINLILILNNLYFLNKILNNLYLLIYIY